MENVVLGSVWVCLFLIFVFTLSSHIFEKWKLPVCLSGRERQTFLLFWCLLCLHRPLALCRPWLRLVSRCVKCNAMRQLFRLPGIRPSTFLPLPVMTRYAWFSFCVFCVCYQRCFPSDTTPLQQLLNVLFCDWAVRLSFFCIICFAVIFGSSALLFPFSYFSCQFRWVSSFLL